MQNLPADLLFIFLVLQYQYLLNGGKRRLPKNVDELKLTFRSYVRPHLVQAATVAQYYDDPCGLTNPRLLRFLRQRGETDHFVLNIRVVDYLTSLLTKTAIDQPELFVSPKVFDAAGNMNASQLLELKAGFITCQIAIAHHRLQEETIDQAQQAKRIFRELSSQPGKEILGLLSTDFWSYHLALSWLITLSAEQNIVVLERIHSCLKPDQKSSYTVH